MTLEQVETTIRTILSEDFGVPAASIGPEATFRGDFGLDSLDVVDFVMLVKKDLGFEVSLESFRGVDNFGQLIDFVAQTLSGAKA